MEIFGIGTSDLLILIVLAMVLVGPDHLPEYVGKLRTFIRQAREMADGAKSQLKDQMGPEFQDIDWRAYDPRQYDPRKIVRDALFDSPGDGATPDADAVPPTPAPYLNPANDFRRFDPDRATPFDHDAT